jgi:hypothetical protein
MSNEQDPPTKYFTKLFHGILTSSRWVGSSSEEKVVLTTMLALKDQNGFVPASVPGIAKEAEVSVEVARASIEKLKSPDPESRSKAFEGRTIEEVEGGFMFLNHSRNGNGAEKRTQKKRTQNNRLEQSRSDGITDTETDTDNASVTYTGTDTATDTWHSSERKVFHWLTVESHRRSFVMVRGFAEFSAAKGDSDFPIVQEFLAKKLGCSQPNVSAIIKEFIRLGIIELTREARFIEHQTARYRWTLETTLSIPAPSDDLDLGEEPF